MKDQLTALKLFARVSETGGFSSAGRDLGLSQPSASRLIAQLEAHVGAALVRRTTRATRLTEAGAAYLTRVTAILSALEEADHEARGTGDFRGTLRVGVSSSFLMREIIPRLAAFMESHPALRLELVAKDQYQDLIAEGIDVAFRFGPLRDSAALARKIMETSRILVASRRYIAEFGAPAGPDDLMHHSIILGPMQPSSMFSFQRNGRFASVRVNCRLAIALDEGAIAASVAGLGIVSSSLNSCQSELMNGSLVRVLPEWDMGSLEIHALYATGKTVRPAARALTEYLIDKFRVYRAKPESAYEINRGLQSGGISDLLSSRMLSRHSSIGRPAVTEAKLSERDHSGLGFAAFGQSDENHV
jgi:DNA-binding transcriptional LysR family regulator